MASIKIVALDFDGVLNNHQTKERHGPVIGFDPRNVAVLNQFLETARTKIVVTSSWRWNHTVPELRALLKKVGVRGEVLDATAKTSSSRGQQIQSWLSRHPAVEGFVIIDDSTDMDHLLPKLVRTSMETGFIEKHVPQALKILAEPMVATLKVAS